MADHVRTLIDAGIRHRVHNYGADASMAQVAAELGLPPAALLKTIAVASMPAVVLACVPSDRRVDIDRLAAHLGEGRTVAMNVQALERMTGFQPGGVTPIPAPGGRRFRVVIDTSALGHAEVAVGAGMGIEVVLAPADLVAVTRAEVAAIAA
jgi:Cys-tRNA(Pro)/Cys-tRNA(Cys) deacylase